MIKRLLLSTLLLTSGFADEIPEPQKIGPTTEAFAEKEAKRYRLKVGVFLVLMQEDQVLLLKRFNTGIADGNYVVPMGALDPGETVTTAAIREAQEEANIHLEPEDVRVRHVVHHLYTMPDGTTFEQMDIFFVATNYTGTPTNMEPTKCDELKFYPITALPPQTDPLIFHALGKIHKGESYSEFGWPDEQ